VNGSNGGPDAGIAHPPVKVDDGSPSRCCQFDATFPQEQFKIPSQSGRTHEEQRCQWCSRVPVPPE
jgi:hypothetical protein